MQSRFTKRSQPASLLQPVIYFLASTFCAYGFVLAFRKNINNNITLMGGQQ